MELVMWLSLALVFLLGPIVLIHELGHFLFAKWAGARVLEFGLGFPPRLFTFAQERGVLEVGGVRMVLPPRLRLPRELEPGQEVEVLARPQEDGYRVLQVIRTEERPGRQETVEGLRVRGAVDVLEPGTRYSLNLLPAGAFVRIFGEEDPSDPKSLAAKPKRWRLAVLLSGALLNLLAAILILTAAYTVGAPRYFVQVAEVVEDTPAEAAGLQVGDVLAAVDGNLLQDGPPELKEMIDASPEQTVVLTVLRAGEEQNLAATPLLEEDGTGFLGIGMLSWTSSDNLITYSFPCGAAAAAAKDIVGVFKSIVQLPHMVSTGEVTPSEVRPAALPGILEWLALALKHSLEHQVAFPALRLTAMISLALGLTNLLPLPALDGGRALFVLIEAVRGRRIDPQVEATIHMVGMMVILLLSLVAVVMDITNPLIPWSSLGP